MSISNLFSVRDFTAASPVIIHAPHGSTHIPDHLRSTLLLSDAELAREIHAMTDGHTDEIAELVASQTGASVIRSELSRLIVDIEKFVGEMEELFERGMSALYTRTSWGQLSRSEPFTAWPEFHELMDFYRAYGLAFEHLTTRALETHGRAVIIDLHSYPVEPAAYEIHAHEARPEIDLGVDDTHTPQWLVSAASDALADFECGVNQSFHGTYVPLKFYGTDTRVSSIMLEIRRDMIEHQRDQIEPAIARLVSQLGE